MSRTIVEFFDPKECMTTRLAATLASVPRERSLGLSGTRFASHGPFMWFGFPRNVSTPFWFAETFAPLGIVFVAAEGGVVSWHDHVPAGYPVPIYPSSEYRYALECPADWLGLRGFSVEFRFSWDVYASHAVE